MNKIFSFIMSVLSLMQVKTEVPTTGQYDKNFIKLIDLVYGKNFMSQGGKKSVDEMLQNTDPYQKKILDFGCGTGGPAIYIQKSYNATVTGVDVDDVILEEAQEAIRKTDIHIDLVKITSNTLPFEDNSFDIIFSKEVILHIENKEELFKELYRVLKPGGSIVIFDWFHEKSYYSPELTEFLTIDGLTWRLTTISEYLDLLKKSGFTITEVEDKTEYSVNISTEDVKNLQGTIGDSVKKEFDADTLEYSKKSWADQAEMLRTRQKPRVQDSINVVTIPPKINFPKTPIEPSIKYFLVLLQTYVIKAQK